MFGAMMALAAYSLWFAGLPTDAPQIALWPSLLGKGIFGVLPVIPVAGLTFRSMREEDFAHGYRNKNLLRQMAGSFAQAVAAILMYNRQTTVYAKLIKFVNPYNPNYIETMNHLQSTLLQQGVPAPQVPPTALAQLSAIIQQQVQLLPCADLYRFLAALAAIAAVVILAQRQLR